GADDLVERDVLGGALPAGGGAAALQRLLAAALLERLAGGEHDQHLPQGVAGVQPREARGGAAEAVGPRQGPVPPLRGPAPAGRRETPCSLPRANATRRAK